MGPKSIIVQRTLYDIRDQKTYSIAKLPDGNCWMTQNLALGSASEDTLLTSADSNVSSNFTIPSSAVQTSGDDLWDVADALHVYIQNDSDPNNGAPYGNLYNWYTATAGTGNTSTPVSTNVSADICPKGWRLPDGGPSTDESFKSLDIAMGGTGVNRSDDATFRDKYRANPYLFPYSGRYNYNGGLDSQESYGLWWSRSAFTLAGNAYRFTLSSSGAVRPQDALNVRYGFSVRCIADNTTPGTLTVSPDTIYADIATTVDVSIPLSGDYDANISLGDTALTCSRTSTSPLTYSCNISSATSGTYTLTASVPGYGKNYTGTLTVEIPSLSNMCSNAPLTTSAGSPYFTFDGVDYIKLNTASSTTSGVDGFACYTKTSQGSAPWGNAASLCPANTGVPTQEEFISVGRAYGYDGTIYNTTGWSGIYWTSTRGSGSPWYLAVSSSKIDFATSYAAVSRNVLCIVRAS